MDLRQVAILELCDNAVWSPAVSSFSFNKATSLVIVLSVDGDGSAVFWHAQIAAEKIAIAKMEIGLFEIIMLKS